MGEYKAAAEPGKYSVRASILNPSLGEFVGYSRQCMLQPDFDVIGHARLLNLQASFPTLGPADTEAELFRRLCFGPSGPDDLPPSGPPPSGGGPAGPPALPHKGGGVNAVASVARGSASGVFTIDQNTRGRVKDNVVKEKEKVKTEVAADQTAEVRVASSTPPPPANPKSKEKEKAKMKIADDPTANQSEGRGSEAVVELSNLIASSSNSEGENVKPGLPSAVPHGSFEFSEGEGGGGNTASTLAQGPK